MAAMSAAPAVAEAGSSYSSSKADSLSQPACAALQNLAWRKSDRNWQLLCILERLWAIERKGGSFAFVYCVLSGPQRDPQCR